MVYGMIPVDLLDPDKKEDVLIYIKNLPIQPEDRKRVLLYWCKEVGVALDRDMVKKAGAK